MPDNDWVRRILDVPGNFFGQVTVEYRAGQVHKVVRSESFVSPETLEQKNRAYEKSIEGTKPIIRAHDYAAK
jgi:hypothetical protein